MLLIVFTAEVTDEPIYLIFQSVDSHQGDTRKFDTRFQRFRYDRVRAQGFEFLAT